ncbi:MAG: FG-GAP repeat domain-containing protein, partial [Blastocatellia bacterium]
PPSADRLAASPGGRGLGSPDAKQQDVPPPPPPFPGTPPVREARPEPLRSLIGATEEDLREVERYLPEGAKVYTYPVSESSLAAAIMTADLDGDGKDDTVVVYSERNPKPEEGSLPLIMSVLAQNGKMLRVRSSTLLLGEIFFNPRIEGIGGPIAIQDVTGDGRPEIIVVSGGGASVGGALQAFSFNGVTLLEVAHIGGHFFKVRSRGVSKASLITARWNGEKEARTYEWSGEAFEQVGRPKSQ